jgi:hypothetical protein
MAKGVPMRFISGHHNRLWPLYKIDQNTECWIWLGRLDRYGYGRHRVNGKDVRAYRWMWEREHGRRIPKQKHTHHICENHICVNPKHLLIITQQEHIQITWQKRREREGVKP